MKKGISHSRGMVLPEQKSLWVGLGTGGGIMHTVIIAFHKEARSSVARLSLLVYLV